MHFSIGDPIPRFVCDSSSNPQYHFDTVAGRFIVLMFFGSATQPLPRQALNQVLQKLRHFFNDSEVAFFGVSIDPMDKAAGILRESMPGVRFLWDLDLAVSRMFGAADSETQSCSPVSVNYRCFTLILDPALRIFSRVTWETPERHCAELQRILEELPSLDDHSGAAPTAPVLVLPRVFEPQFCQLLVAAYEAAGGVSSGFMREVAGQTVTAYDVSVKQRNDFLIEAEDLKEQIRSRLIRRLLPEIKRTFQFNASYVERYLVACYEEGRGFFKAHRDNTTKGTAHRRFACTINLNAEEYAGGDLCFPEFGPRTYRAPTGGAVVFSASLLHEAQMVTRGRRFAFLPFFYDNEAAKIREENQKYVGYS